MRAIFNPENFELVAGRRVTSFTWGTWEVNEPDNTSAKNATEEIISEIVGEGYIYDPLAETGETREFFDLLGVRADITQTIVNNAQGLPDPDLSTSNTEKVLDEAVAVGDALLYSSKNLTVQEMVNYNPTLRFRIGDKAEIHAWGTTLRMPILSITSGASESSRRDWAFTLGFDPLAERTQGDKTEELAARIVEDDQKLRRNIAEKGAKIEDVLSGLSFGGLTQTKEGSARDLEGPYRWYSGDTKIKSQFNFNKEIGWSAYRWEDDPLKYPGYIGENFKPLNGTYKYNRAGKWASLAFDAQEFENNRENLGNNVISPWVPRVNLPVAFEAKDLKAGTYDLEKPGNGWKCQKIEGENLTILDGRLNNILRHRFRGYGYFFILGYVQFEQIGGLVNSDRRRFEIHKPGASGFTDVYAEDVKRWDGHEPEKSEENPGVVAYADFFKAYLRDDQTPGKPEDKTIIGVISDDPKAQLGTLAGKTYREAIPNVGKSSLYSLSIPKPTRYRDGDYLIMNALDINAYHEEVSRKIKEVRFYVYELPDESKA